MILICQISKNPFQSNIKIFSVTKGTKRRESHMKKKLNTTIHLNYTKTHYTKLHNTAIHNITLYYTIHNTTLQKSYNDVFNMNC